MISVIAISYLTCTFHWLPLLPFLHAYTHNNKKLVWLAVLITTFIIHFTDIFFTICCVMSFFNVHFYLGLICFLELCFQLTQTSFWVELRLERIIWTLLAQRQIRIFYYSIQPTYVKGQMGSELLF